MARSSRLVLRYARIAAIALVAAGYSGSSPATAAPAEVCEAIMSAPGGDIRITAGRDENTGWLTAELGQLRVRKFTAQGGESVTELTARNDTVILHAAAGIVRVSRNGSSVAIDSQAGIDQVQELLGGSAAMFAARAVLSEHEGRSRLKAPEMSLLSALAFAVSLTGDLGAPLRLADRFMQKHRGVLRLVNDELEGSCWTSYQSEVDAAWNDLQDCMVEAGDGIMGSVRRLACNGTWLLRGESAWFEYIKCLSPMTIAKLD